MEDFSAKAEAEIVRAIASIIFFMGTPFLLIKPMEKEIVYETEFCMELK